MLPVRKDIMSTLYERCQKVMSGVSGRATKLGVVDSDGAYLYTEDGRKVLLQAALLLIISVLKMKKS